MAGNRNRRFAKRKKEQARQEKAAEKRKKKAARASGSGYQPGDPHVEHVPVGPQGKDKASDQEVMDAIERAMNPGKMRDRVETESPGGARLFVGNLDYDTEEQELRELFVSAGFEVSDAAIVTDRDTGDPRGFAFVEVSGGTGQGQRAIQALNGQEFRGRELRINAASPSGRR